MPDDKTPNPAEMLSFAPSPIFSNWDHRPSVPSPLSSSPLRASSPISHNDDTLMSQRQAQSSPIQPPKFKFAARTTRPNPMMRKREDAQTQRRKNFLQNVRDKAEDKAWQRRDIEGHFLKTNWLADLGQRSYDAPEFSEADIEDAMTFRPETPQPVEEEDEMAMDDAEDREFEAMIASVEQQQPQRPPSPSLSDEEDYDAIFAELISQQEEQAQHQSHDFGDAEMEM